MEGIIVIEEKIFNIIVNQFNVERDSINKDTSFTNDLNADSLDLVELIMSLEDEFDLELEDENIDGINTINDVIVHINSLTSDVE